MAVSTSPACSVSSPSGTLPEPLASLLRECARQRASDLHLAPGQPPLLRRLGKLEPLAAPALEDASLAMLADALLTSKQQALLARDGSLDTALNAAGQRFRLNIFRARGGLGLAFRRLDQHIASLQQLGLPARLAELQQLRDGLVLVCGATGSGKSTTLAALIDGLNRSRALHILTIEDPVEYLHTPARGLVRQRELHTDVPSFEQAVEAALREDPDVILVGEMRNCATLRATLTAAETGHLVFSTLHARDCVGAVERFVGAFPQAEQAGARLQLSLVLQAILAQRLLHGAERLWPVVEVLRRSPAVANLIRNAKPAQLRQVLETGSQLGMQTFDGALADAVARGRISRELAQSSACSPAAFAEKLRGLRHG